MGKGFRIAVDCYEVCHPASGFGEYTLAVAERLARRAPELKKKYGIEFWFLVPDGYVGIFGDDVTYINERKYTRFTRLALRIFPRRYAIYHRLQQFSRIRRLYFARKEVLTLHDINFEHDPTERHLKKRRRRIARWAKRVEALVLISKFVEEDVKARFEVTSPTWVIYNGVTDLRPLAQEPAGKIPGLPENYLFHLSSLQSKKNAALLIDMMNYLPDQTLVIAGNWRDFGEPLRERMKENKYGNVVALENVTAEEKAHLMAHCKAFLFPSLCEGFGLPPLEAMYFGKPVFLSTLTSLPEVGGEYAYYWEELLPEKMAAGVAEKLADDRISPEARTQWASRFQWDRTVDDYIEVYKTLLGIEE